MTVIATPATVPTLPETMPPSVKAIVESVLETTRCLVPVFSTLVRTTHFTEDVSASYTLKHEGANLECDVAVIRIEEGYAEIVFQVVSRDTERPFDVGQHDRALILWEMEVQLGDVEVDDLSNATFPRDEDEPFELRFRIPVASLY